MLINDFNNNNDIKPKAAFRTLKNFYKNNSKDNIFNNPIMEYSYPICIFKKVNKEAEELRKVKYRIICSTKEPKQKPKNKKYIKRNLSSNLILQNPMYEPKEKNVLSFKKNNFLELKKKLLRSNSIPIYPFCEQENNLYRKDHLSQIEKRGNYYNKLLIASLQRHALNKFNLNCMKKANVEKINFVLNNLNQQNKIEEYEKIDEMKQFINNRIFVVNEKLYDIDEYFNLKKKRENLPKINKKGFKFHVFRDKNGREKDITKSPVRNLRMTKEKVRDLKVMCSINKIRDPEIIQKYKAIIHG